MRARAAIILARGTAAIAVLLVFGTGRALATPAADPLDAIARDVAAYKPAQPSAPSSINPGRAKINRSTRDSAAAPDRIDLRLGGDETGTRVVLDLAGPPAGRPVITSSAGRLLISTPGEAPRAVSQGAGRGLVSRWRITPSASAALVDLAVAPGVEVMRRFLLPPSGDVGAWRYVIDLDRPSLESGQIAAARAALSGAAEKTQASASAVALVATPAIPTSTDLAARPRARSVEGGAALGAARTTGLSFGRPKVIVIDAGHGGHDTGAESLLRNEKDINLAAALDLKRRLERSGHYRVVLTRATDVFIPLTERVQIARRAKADLFISLHSDSAGTDPTPHGASIYTLSDRGTTRVRQVMNGQDLYAGLGDPRRAPTVSQILLDLTQQSTRNRSAVFAGMLLDHLSGAVDLLPHGHRDANYFVLLAPDVPAVLLEMGFITNPGDEMRLTDPDELQGLMNRVGDAVDEYFAPRAEVASR